MIKLTIQVYLNIIEGVIFIIIIKTQKLYDLPLFMFLLMKSKLILNWRRFRRLKRTFDTGKLFKI